MKHLITLLFCFTCFAQVQTPLETLNNELIDKLNRVEKAKLNIIKDHIVQLERLKVAYTKRGDLKKAIEIQSAIKDLIPNDVLSHFKGDWKITTSNGFVQFRVTDKQVFHIRTANNSNTLVKAITLKYKIDESGNLLIQKIDLKKKNVFPFPLGYDSINKDLKSGHGRVSSGKSTYQYQSILRLN